MDRGRGFNRGGIGNFRGNRGGRGMMRGGFGNGPSGRGMMRGSRGGGPGRGPPRMGLGYMNRGLRGGRGGRGGFQNSNNDFNQPPQNDNIVAASTPAIEGSGSEKPVTATPPVTTQSGNNVQVVTTGPTPVQQQPPQQPPQGPPQSSSAPIQSNPSMHRGGGGHRMGRGFTQRGFGGRGRGFNHNMPPRQQFDTRQPSNLTQTMPPKMRYDQQSGSMPPKRGRYDNGHGYMGNRNVPPNQPPPMAPQHHGSYNNMPSHGTSGYQDQSQYVDQYGQHNYNGNVQQQGTYPTNGTYNQSYGAASGQMGYQAEYDHSTTGYQDYSQQSYDTRGYSGYSQDYRQSYNGSTETGTYNQVPPESTYSYGEARSSYGTYDSTYSQSYNNQSGYY